MPTRALTELLRGKGAHVDPLACVEDISAELASRPVAGFPHSIAQLLFHMNYWMDYEQRRIRGQRPKYPEHASESFPPGPAVDTQEWSRQRKSFATLLADYAALANSAPEELQRQVESAREDDTKTAGNVEAVLWQMVAHTSYHAGQIVTLRQALGAWPPRGGGDNW